MTLAMLFRLEKKKHESEGFVSLITYCWHGSEHTNKALTNHSENGYIKELGLNSRIQELLRTLAHQAVCEHNEPFFVNIDGLSSGAPELL